MIGKINFNESKKLNKKFMQYIQQKENMGYAMKKMKITNQQKLEKSSLLLIKKYSGKSY
jgi:hypothetical protein